jgi:hypothetical protein
MEVHFAPELQAKIDQLVAHSGCPAEKLLEEAMAIYLADLAQAREMLDSRYDDLKSGKVKPISREEIIAHFREKSAAARRARRFMIACDFHLTRRSTSSPPSPFAANKSGSSCLQ